MGFDLTLALQIIKEFEGCSLVAYQDIVGVWTIGYGTTLGVHSGMIITGDQADAFLENDCNVLSGQITKSTRALKDQQYCALISFAYNLGFSALYHSTLLKDINAGASDSDIVAQFMLWNHAGGKVVSGLTKRRAAEAALYIS